jgi:hypothetical protein
MSEPLTENGTVPDDVRSTIAKNQLRDKFGHFVKKAKDIKLPPLISTSDSTIPQKDIDPPVVNFKITNPLTYIKAWWKKIMGNEGVELSGHIKVRPMTAVAIPTFIILALVTGAISVGILVNYIANTPAAPFVPAAFLPTPTTDPWRDSAFTGLLRQTGATYYLVTGDGEAIALSVPQNTSLQKYLGKRIFATGRYNSQTEVLVVNETSDLEILPLSPSVVPSEF